MASRYPSVKSHSYCYHPLRIFRDGEQVIVPCGKCNGCLLHKANAWSMRLGNDIEFNPNTLFFTLTYTNKYIPHAIPSFDSPAAGRYFVHHVSNIRFNGVEDVQRKEEFKYIDSHTPIPITNSFSDCVPYLSKRDIQLYLKLLRKDLFLNFADYGESHFFRYFIVGEYGPTKYRPHYHAVLLPTSHEVSEYLLELGLYKSWQMCDKDLFDRYAHYCDSGARGYVTQYLTSYSHLPSCYQCKEIKPFRLSSKRTSTGTLSFDFKEVFENVLSGVVEYRKDVSRIGQQYIFCYPKEVTDSLFPKCYRFRLLSFDGLLNVYGRLYAIRKKFPRINTRLAFHRLHPFMRVADEFAAVACLKWCDKFEISPYVYCLAIDRFYYLKNMYILRNWYNSMDLTNNAFDVLCEYSNFSELAMKYKMHGMTQEQEKRFLIFLEPFGLGSSELEDISIYRLAELIKYKPSVDYINDVDDIVSQMEKMPKYNILTGQSPVLLT